MSLDAQRKPRRRECAQKTTEPVVGSTNCKRTATGPAMPSERAHSHICPRGTAKSGQLLGWVAVLAIIPYKTFPTIAIGPLELRTFGVMVGVGVLLGAWMAARYIEQRTDISRDDTYRLATILVVA